jgi:glucan-binding YG repeat protein
LRKQTKLVAVLSAAALLAIGASMTSFAATGWQEESGTWVYYYNDGYKVSNEWKKSGNNWFYLNDDGEMATETLVEDGDYTYYVDENGVMAANRWVQVANDDDNSDDAPANYWYYFQSSGKAYKAGDSTSFKTINGKKYAFDDEGKMLYGWVDGTSNRITDDEGWKESTTLYYCGTEDDGAQRVGWSQIHVINKDEDDEDQDYWFYFKANGKKLFAEDGDSITNKTINGRKYGFNSWGKMVSGWTEATAGEIPTASNYQNYSTSEDGSRRKGWFKAVPTDKINKEANQDDEEKWFYANNDGYLVVNQLKTINGKKYAFYDKDEMLSGLYALGVDDDNLIWGAEKIDSESKVKSYWAPKEEDAKAGIPLSDERATYVDENNIKLNVDVYYFGSSDDGSMKTGVQNVDVDGDTYAYFFGKSGNNKGKGFGSTTVGNYSDTVLGDGTVVKTFIYDKSAMYVQGRKIKADSDLKYEAFDAVGVKVSARSEGYKEEPLFLLNSSGSLMKNKKNVKDGNDMYYCTDGAGRVTYYGSEKCDSKDGVKHDKNNIH